MLPRTPGERPRRPVMRRVVFVCLTAALLAGCTSARHEPIVEEKKQADGATEDKTKGPADDEGNPPHGGILADWSSERTDNKYHVEVCVDRGKKEVSVYVLGDDARTPAPIEADQLLLA